MAYPTTTPRRAASSGSGNLNVPYSIGVISGSLVIERVLPEMGVEAEAPGSTRARALGCA